MNKAERAALTALLDNVGLGYTKHQAETKLLPPTIPSPRPSHRIRVRHLGNVRATAEREDVPAHADQTTGGA